MLLIRRIFRNKWIIGALGIVFVAILAFSIASYFLINSVPAKFAAGSIEAKYAAAGALEVETAVITDEQGENLYKIYYPSLLDTTYPLIAWGNGTGALPANYDGLFQHLASWGFVIIDTYNTTTGTGKEIVESITYMLDENDNPASLFYQKIQADQIAAAGHSQGSTGVINAHNHFERGAEIKTVVSIALPELKYCDPEDVYDTSAIKVPFLVLGGTRDFIISPSDSNNLAVSDANPDIPAMMAMAKGAAHTAIEKDGGQHRGYLTAWMRYRLMNDSEAMVAFEGKDAEIVVNKRWKDVMSNEQGS
ncbi:poly(ethylene terephthalate) hydrolase family protein [Paenibacillus radicis (ex Gao et al. 2016)]|uniref:Lipase n=1 Tax=Paenibacillus radicis (ex Gao et al. 2016) TaxID=1737354 RepID=A0A917LSE1_9BACL|nr:alpha/beta hydrolase [Paenibacillus radicis (ex Gao et al. 2016)]GGG53746.1 lipase [Paenibacillus radicis (ex Gao et al. 2016)]